ncbi:leucine-rich repeat domain-containing protein [Candidatus Uabimicrobium amorphum]|uniref:Internalin-I n=1 Tax=Uabimicrobium amorphum TaxID=2596890 RepID=A0A5S9F6G3_UABAM|nr:hypothetical protein [Candidatus Uabimicrobium amorphum]BBM87662.1 internalin-I [Candidatus Uabimicrobium amorphum]
MKHIQQTQVIHNNETYRGHIFYLDKNVTQYWENVHFYNCSFRGDMTIGNMKNCTFENCSFSGTVGVRIQFLGDKQIPEWCFMLPHVERLRIYDPQITSLPSNIVELQNLIELDVSGCSDLRMLNGIENLDSLRFLNLKECYWVDQNWVQYAPQITELNLNSVNLFSPQLHILKNLERLSLKNVPFCNYDIFSSMPRLSYLDISGGNFAGDVDVLKNLHNLKFLDCSNVRGIHNAETSFFLFLTKLEYLNVSSIAIDELHLHLPHLKTLKLERCSALRNIDIDCEKLRYLTLRDCHNLDNLDFLNKLHNLRHLDTQYCKAQKNHTLSLPSTIEHCNIIDCTSIAQVKNTDQLSNLKELHIGSNVLDNFDFCKLSHVRSLRLNKIYLESENNIREVLQSANVECLDVDGRVCGIDNLKNLRELRLRYCTLDDFSSLPTSIIAVHLHHCHFINRSIFDAWRHIRSLHIESGSTEAYFRVIPELENLTTLSIRGGTMSDLGGLWENSSIQTLRLEACHNLSNIEALTSFTKLQCLSIKFCSQVDFSCLKKLQNLRVLTLYNANTQTIPGLENLKSTDIHMTTVSE